MRRQKESNPMKNITIRMSPEEITWLREESKKEMRPIGNTVRKILAEYREAKKEVLPSP